MFEMIARLLARRQTQPPQHERGSHVMAWPARSESGIYVTDDAAMSQGTAWACGTLIARSIAMLPAQVMAPRGPDDRDGNERLSDHPVATLLHREANPELSAFRFREGALLSAIFQGNAFAEIESDQVGRPFALWPIHSERVTICRDGNGVLEYEVDNGVGDKVTIPARSMFHLAGPSLCSPVGVSLISYARNTLGLALAQERFAGNFIRNQAAPSGLVKVKSNLSESGFRRLRSEFDQLYKGTRNAGKVVYSDGDVEWQQIGLSQQDAEFLAQRRFAVEEICRWFGVPPQMVGDQSKQTFANFEQAGLNFLALAILPWVVRFEQEVNRKLLRVASGRKPFLKINTGAIVRANLEAQYRAFSLGRQWGWLSVNDIRRMSDMEPIGPEGDVYLQPMNMTPLIDPSRNHEASDDDHHEEDGQRPSSSLRRVM